MKNNKRTMTGMAAMLLASACIASTAAAVSAEANAPSAANAYTVTAGHRYERPPGYSIQEWYNIQVARLRSMREREVKVTISSSDALYYLKSSKFYGRKAIVVIPEESSLILGPWEVINTSTDHYNRFKITGDYVMLAYSGDIVWGTDFPFSGIFWNEPIVDLTKVDIKWTGGCRNANIEINTYYTEAYHAYGYELEEYWECQKIKISNCDSHSEWKPAG